MTWKEVLAPIKNSDYFRELWSNVQQEYRSGKCFPPKEQIFRALELTAFDEVKVVILGQDPYHGDLQANGLCFSVSDRVAAPPSLRNIFKELHEDLGIQKNSNELDDWAKQGVLLLNSSLSVKAYVANSHKHLGWEKLTDFIVKSVSDHKNHVVFVLWGSYAQKKTSLIDETKHLVLKSVHPSPLSAYRGFFGSRPFSKINSYLASHGQQVINW